ncbi:peptidase A4 family-domain-containing protein [Cubamyces lactineus]|nr:peptidase A4 family-domain-containing protein [Cubamyces lactineus]
MQLTSVLALGLLIISPALGRPSSTFVSRAIKRGRPALPFAVVADAVALKSKPTSTPTSGAASSHPTTSSFNWAGVVLPNPPVGENFTAVTGTFTVPTLAPSAYAATSIWVGIDGWNTDFGSDAQGLFQAGIDCWMEDGKLSFDTWYEWVPDGSYNFTGFDISVGDVLTFSLAATSPTEGTIDVENETTGQKIAHVLDAPPLANSQLALQSADWIMEDFFWNGQVPLADFGTVHFTNASAKTTSGNTVGLADATIVNLVLDGSMSKTKVTVDSDSSATITYVSAFNSLTA